MSASAGDRSASVYRLESGNLLVPVDEEQPAGSCATGMREVEAGTAEHAAWLQKLEARDPQGATPAR